jgi:hypothetical protein
MAGEADIYILWLWEPRRKGAAAAERGRKAVDSQVR